MSSWRSQGEAGILISIPLYKMMELVVLQVSKLAVEVPRASLA